MKNRSCQRASQRDKSSKANKEKVMNAEAEHVEEGLEAEKAFGEEEEQEMKEKGEEDGEAEGEGEHCDFKVIPLSLSLSLSHSENPQLDPSFFAHGFHVSLVFKVDFRSAVKQAQERGKERRDGGGE